MTVPTRTSIAPCLFLGLCHLGNTEGQADNVRLCSPSDAALVLMEGSRGSWGWADFALIGPTLPGTSIYPWQCSVASSGRRACAA